MTVPAPTFADTDVEGPLERVGFRAVGDDGSYRYRVDDDEYLARWQRRWLTIETGPRPSDERATTTAADRAGPGLWRPLGDRAESTGRVFDLPAAACMAEEDFGDDALDGEQDDAGQGSHEVLESCLRWAIDSDRSGPLDDWTPPTREQVDDLVARSATTVRVGDIVRECVVHLDDDRLALRCPIVLSIPPDLPASRRSWLDRLADETQRRWRIVRVDVDGNALIAAVDLTGSPPGTLPGLVDAALAGLRCSVAWAARPAAAIVSGTESVILDSSPVHITPTLEAAKGATNA